ncbi:MAG: efflux RND transporter periplasmic adaptor subunit [Pseudomonadota bacterium]
MKLICIAFAMLLYLSTGVLAQGGPASVTTSLVEPREVAETVTIFGQVVARRESAVAARVSGVVDKVHVRIGDRVAEGDLLAEIDTELLGIQRAEAEAQDAIAQAGLSVAQARLDQAQRAYDRAEALSASATISPVQRDDREGELAEARGAQQEARARILAAQATLALATYNLERAKILAPFDATVLDVSTEVGQFISIGADVALLLDTGAAEVVGDVPARYIGALRPGLAVNARADDGGTLALTARAILPTEFSATRTRPVRFAIEQNSQEVAIGQSLTLDIPVSAPRNAIIVPKDALIQSPGGWSVFVHQDGKAVPRPVQIGTALGDSFEVLGGLVDGDEVVIRGNERLRPMQDIAPVLAGKDTEAPQGG